MKHSSAAARAAESQCSNIESGIRESIGAERNKKD